MDLYSRFYLLGALLCFVFKIGSTNVAQANRELRDRRASASPVLE